VIRRGGVPLSRRGGAAVVRRAVAAVAAALALLVVLAGPAAAYEPVRVVHAERVQVGPYAVTVGFSAWPLRAMQSLDFTFVPDGGIAGLSGTLELVAPGEAEGESEPLARHPRKLDVWGLDIFALDTEGEWTMRFVIDGPEGRGEGVLPLPVLEQPGPPLALSWSISVLPLVGLLAFLVVTWRRHREEATRV
jgi:hypothetical protein